MGPGLMRWVPGSSTSASGSEGMTACVSDVNCLQAFCLLFGFLPEVRPGSISAITCQQLSAWASKSALGACTCRTTHTTV
jgi:hypothetical protein